MSNKQNSNTSENNNNPAPKKGFLGTVSEQFKYHPGLSIFYTIMGSLSILYWLAILSFLINPSVHYNVGGWALAIIVGFVISIITNLFMGDTWPWKKFAGYRLLLLFIGAGVWYLAGQIFM